MNETLETIKKRYSCRGYEDKPVETEKIEAIIKAALQSPSAFNKQPWHVIAITNKAIIDEANDHVMDLLREREDQTAYERIMDRGGKPYYNAPLMFLILKKQDMSEWASVDSGIVVQNMTLAAMSLGLGSVIAAMCATAFQGPKADEFKQKVNWPEGYEFGIGLLAGYPAMEKEPHEIDLAKVTYV
ncbi:MAG: nitroreductase [Defluviitaleaceae bacterium]|nr:nitroreductase [Defluviitaleaceae bacterium]